MWPKLIGSKIEVVADCLIGTLKAPLTYHSFHDIITRGTPFGSILPTAEIDESRRGTKGMYAPTRVWLVGIVQSPLLRPGSVSVPVDTGGS